MNKSRTTEGMTHVRRSLVLGLILAAGLGSRTHADFPGRYDLADLKALEQGFVELADKVEPSVVAIRTYRVLHEVEAQGHSRKVTEVLSRGSGFVLDAKGYIVTNKHVLDEADAVTVLLPTGQEVDAPLEFARTDARFDIAILKVDAEGLVPAALGDVRHVRRNQWVFASGNPYGFAADDGRTSISYGVISALGRSLPQLAQTPGEYYGNLIETTCSIHPGSSGGPLFNIDGEVIGIVTAVQATTRRPGLGFALPIDRYTRRVIESLKDGKGVRHGFLGVSVDLRWRGGARIADTPMRHGPADRAGIRRNDIVLEFDGVEIESGDQLIRLVGYTQSGTAVRIKIRRDDEILATTVTLTDAPWSEFASRGQ